MKRTLFKLKFSLIITLLFGLCLALISTATVFAGSNDNKKTTIQAKSVSEDNDLMKKQQAIDKYVFEEHAKDIEKQGFKVTNTGQVKDYVEIGIIPFTKKNADYLYNIFGKDKVKVVEGQQAVLIKEEVKTTASKVEKVSASKSETESSKPDLLTYAPIIIVIAGIVVLIVQKRKTA